MNYKNHPLNLISDSYHVANQPVDDATDVEIKNLPLKSGINVLKQKIGFYLYPVKNILQQKMVVDKLEKMSGYTQIRDKPTVFSWGQKGSGQDIFIFNIKKKFRKKNSIVLCYGCGLGEETKNIAKYLKPQKIIAVDYFNYKTHWDKLISEIKADFLVDVEFYQIDIKNNATIIKENSIDLIYSSAVLEHLKNMDEVFQLFSSWLKKDGYFTAQWGPMWYSYSGDHISAELGLANAYKHVLLNSEEYLNYYKNHPRNKKDVENGKLTWLELGLHNFATYNEYIESLKRNFGKILFLQWVIIPDALIYKKLYPENWSVIFSLNENITELDLILSDAGIILKKGIDI